jgi:hypothetical protein
MWIKTAAIEASGGGAIFDVKATASGTLRVGTKAGRVGDRWWVTIAQATGAGAVSAVGSGSFPASVKVRFTGPTDATNPPVVPVSGGTLASILPRPIRWPEPPAGCPGDGSALGCGALVSCELNPAGDTDSFKATVPANSGLAYP